MLANVSNWQRVFSVGLPEGKEVTDLLLTRLLGDVLDVDGARHVGLYCVCVFVFVLGSSGEK